MKYASMSHMEVRKMFEQAIKEVSVKEIKELTRNSLEKRHMLHSLFESKTMPVDGCFEKTQNVIDDNGKIFREGNSLLPEKSFEVNGYHYQTDELGRVTKAEGKIRIEEGRSRNMEDVRRIDDQEYKEEDQRGHLIGHRFGGSDRLENLVPMDAELNQKAYAGIENRLADAMKDGADVRLKVEPIYEGNSTRPKEFKISYSIDGEKEITILKNGGIA